MGGGDAIPFPPDGSGRAAGDETPDAAAAALARESGSARAAAMVGAGILLSRIFGFVRNFLFARYLGITDAADAYTAALKIPNVVRNLLGEGTISASFIPVYSAMLGRGDETDARRLAGAVLGLLLVFVSVLTLAGIGLAPLLTAVFLQGYDPATRELATRLMRVMFPMTGVMVISAWCLGIQNSHRRFFISYASAILWSLAQIVLLLGWAPGIADLTRLAWYLAWATLAGALLQVAAQLPEALKLTAPLRVQLDPSAPGLARTVRNFVPVVLALGVVQISSFIDVFLAGWLPDGTLASLEYARIVFLLPIGLFGVSVAAASLPELARESSVQAMEPLRERLRAGWMRIAFYIVPSMVVFVAFGDHVISLLYRSGEFGLDATRVAHLILAGFALGLLGFASVKLFASAYYALQDYRTPLRAGIIGLVVFCATAGALTWVFRDSYLGAAGIALGSSVAAYVNLGTLVHGLRRRMGALYTAGMWRGTARIAGSAAIAGGAAALAEWLLRGVHFRLAAVGTLLAFGSIFIVVAYAFGSAEARRWLRTLRLSR
jgi:putative peptidoglycan lipid II flippase